MRAIGHGIDVDEFACTERAGAARCRALVLGRYSPAKGLETILRGGELAGVHVEAHGSDATFEALQARARAPLRRATPSSAGPSRAPRCPALFARSHVLVNNMRAGAPDKVVYEAAASCLPVLASNPVFDDLLPPELRFERDDAERLAERLRALDRRRRPELRERRGAQPLGRALGRRRARYG